MTPHSDRQHSAIKYMCQFDLKTTVCEIEAERIIWLIHKYLKWFDKVYGHISKDKHSNKSLLCSRMVPVQLLACRHKPLTKSRLIGICQKS